ncbi:hypothetical protein GCM10007874_31420 [Labrys miyagiensis]|uniref:Uncharacterized protein n=1 Tax=Labrys miyagiensis TaxID=346912 RepID=A0ABQ6CML7_9HYPH|nr:hypothetical protein [Labrys miyagiensis]GLS20125.1 hypothetical protein GCM10007874_31420 [Labrys miyagiensis]
MVDISDMTARSTVGNAKSKAQAFVHELRATPPDKTFILGSKLWNIAVDASSVIVKPLQHPVRNEFMYSLGQPFGGTTAFIEQFDGDDELLERVEWTVLTLGQYDDLPLEVSSASSLNAIHWDNTSPELPKFPVWKPQNGTVVIPLTATWVDSGVLHTYTYQIFKEESTAQGTENYVDVYISADVGGKIPVLDVLTIDLKAGVKTGHKKYTKEETKNAVRTGTQVSRNFTVQKVGRHCLVMSPRNVTPPYGSAEIVDVAIVQFGYQIIPREGGDTLGPYWPWYHLNGTEFPDMAYNQAEMQLKKLMEDSAIEIAKKAHL